MSTLIDVEKVSKLDISYYLGSFDTNYIDSRNVGIFKHTFFKEQNFCEGNIESSRIFYLSK